MSRSDLKNVRVLVVEDEPLIAMDLIDQLSEAGAVCIGPALTIQDALELIDCQHVDCAVLDVRVGKESIFPAARRLAEKNVSFVFHTGDGDETALKREWPGCQVLKKPVSSIALIAALRDIQADQPLSGIRPTADHGTDERPEVAQVMTRRS